VTDDLERLPNIHTALHLASNARLFASTINTCATFGEMKHRVWKNIVPHTNFREMDLAFALYDNTMQSLRYIIDSTSSPEHRLARHPLAKVLKFLQRTCPSIFSGQYFSGSDDSEGKENSDDLIDLSTDWNISDGSRFANGKLWRRLSVKQARKNGLAWNLCDVEKDDIFLRDVRRGFQRVFESKPPLTAFRELGALEWWTKLTVFDNVLHTHLSIRIGSIVGFRVDCEGLGDDVVNFILRRN
jgi:hypothetical protein